MMHRGWWATVVLAHVTLLAGAPGAARAQTFAPHRHVDRSGRLIQDMCPPEGGRGAARCFARRVVAATAGEAVPRGLGGDAVAVAYGVPAAARSGGAIVAVVDAGGDTSALADLQTYRAQFGLGPIDRCAGPVPTAGGAAPCLAIVDQRGGANLPANDPGWAGETSLDLDMVSAACPDCSILLVEARSQNTADLGAAVDLAASVPGVVAVSNSYGWPESGDGSPFSTGDARHFDHPGVAILAASGDQDYDGQGYGGTGPSFPASAPTVIGVGGTVLSPDAGSARGWSETVWNDGVVGSGAQGGGSGCSGAFARPAWQAGIDSGTCSADRRASVDVSAAAYYKVAQGGGGIVVYCGAGCGGSDGGGGFMQVMGTSASTPIVAGVLARLGLATRVGSDPGLLYALPWAFHDIADGSGNDPSGRCHDVMCTAVPGWDGPTGLGTPDGAALAAIAR
jgi:subtilase family serine protease